MSINSNQQAISSTESVVYLQQFIDNCTSEVGWQAHTLRYIYTSEPCEPREIVNDKIKKIAHAIQTAFPDQYTKLIKGIICYEFLDGCRCIVNDRVVKRLDQLIHPKQPDDPIRLQDFFSARASTTADAPLNNPSEQKLALTEPDTEAHKNDRRMEAMVRSSNFF